MGIAVSSLETRDLMGQTPLHYAAEKGHKTMVEMLLKRNANPQAAATFGYSPADAAVNSGHPAIAELIRNWGK